MLRSRVTHGQTNKGVDGSLGNMHSSLDCVGGCQRGIHGSHVNAANHFRFVSWRGLLRSLGSKEVGNDRWLGGRQALARTNGEDRRTVNLVKAAIRRRSRTNPDGTTLCYVIDIASCRMFQVAFVASKSASTARALSVVWLRPSRKPGRLSRVRDAAAPHSGRHHNQPTMKPERRQASFSRSSASVSRV
jgi:hypothetical protein